ncbi:NAD(P)H-dependent oxidoreductase [Carboxylicivirga taeanensis]|uniref:NAD(P)H-dependent oxidoreductase n=1 Tax=Carboxylicivirga taeanensis TaxID=1416875 RepID=UPI003F6DBE6B
MKKILIINGHPDSQSFCKEIAQRYFKGANKVAQCELINLEELEFSPILKHGYRKRTQLEPDLQQAWEAIKAADHLVFVYPNWWGTQPALLKGFIDRVFLPGRAFRYRENSVFWDKLLKGKTARLFVTMDTPKWYYRLVFKQPGHEAMRKGVLHFCGVKPVKITAFSPLKTSSAAKRLKWLEQVEQLGAAGR